MFDQGHNNGHFYRCSVIYDFFYATCYENLPMRYTEILIAIKMKICSRKKNVIVLIFAQHIGCGYTLDEYPQSVFWSKNKNNKYTPAYPSFAI